MDYNNNQYNNNSTGNNPVNQQGVPSQAPLYNEIPSAQETPMTVGQNNMEVNNASIGANLVGQQGVSSQAPLYNEIPSAQETPMTVGQNDMGANTNHKKENSKGNGFLIAIVVIIVLVVGGIFGYKKLMDNPTTIIKNSINDLYANFNDNLKEYEENPLLNAFLNDTITINGNISVNGSFLEKINDDKLTFSLGMDSKNERAEMFANLSEKNKTLLDANIYAKEGKAYMTSKTLFDNMYVIGDVDLSQNSNSLKELQEDIKNLPSTSEVDDVIKEFKDALIKSLDEKELTKEKADITINDETIKVNRLIYNLNEESIKNLFSSTFNELLGNNNFVKNLAKVLRANEEELQDLLIKMSNPEYYESRDGKEGYTGKFILYTTGIKNKMIGIELIDNSKNFHYYNHDGNCNIRLEQGGKPFLEIVGKKEKDVTKITIKSQDENNEGKLVEALILTVRKFDKNGIDLDYNLNLENQTKVDGSLKLTQEKINDKKYEMVSEFYINVEDNGDMGVKINYTAEIGAKIADVDTSKALPIEEITDQDTLKKDKAMKNFENSAFANFITEIKESMEPTIDVDYSACYDNYLDAYYDNTFSGSYEEYAKTYCTSLSM